MARVKLNGHDLGILWKPPFRVDVSDCAREGKNSLEVEVVNLWPNRLIGDDRLPADCKWQADGNIAEWPKWLLEGRPSPTGRHTFTTCRLWTKDSPLLDSGLLGPVRLEATSDLQPVRPITGSENNCDCGRPTFGAVATRGAVRESVACAGKRLGASVVLGYNSTPGWR